jgi:hypothetical protein
MCFPRRKYALATPREQSVTQLELCAMSTAADGYYLVQATAPLAEQPVAGPSRSLGTFDELPTPCFLVRLPIVRRNCQRMAERAAALGVALRPHVKTSVRSGGGWSLVGQCSSNSGAGTRRCRLPRCSCRRSWPRAS